MISKFPAVVLLLLFTIGACGAQGIRKLETRNLSLRSADKTVVIKTEIARTDEERSTGLMHREKLADGEGMLFVFARDEVLSFWMKNTLIPLSIAFISSDGKIIEIRDMVPNSLETVRSSRSVRYALEVPQGWFARAGINPGDTLILADL